MFGQYFYCHQCTRTVRLNVGEEGVTCPICRGSFLEDLRSHYPIVSAQNVDARSIDGVPPRAGNADPAAARDHTVSSARGRCRHHGRMGGGPRIVSWNEMNRNRPRPATNTGGRAQPRTFLNEGSAGDRRIGSEYVGGRIFPATDGGFRAQPGTALDARLAGNPRIVSRNAADRNPPAINEGFRVQAGIGLDARSTGNPRILSGYAAGRNPSATNEGIRGRIGSLLDARSAGIPGILSGNAAGRTPAAPHGGIRTRPGIFPHARSAGNPRFVSGNYGAISQPVAVSPPPQFLQRNHPYLQGRPIIEGGTGVPPHPVPEWFGQVVGMDHHFWDFLFGGDDGQVPLHHVGGEGPAALPGNIGDYYLGPDLQQLIHNLSRDDPTPYGTLPASKSTVQSLPTIRMSEEHLDADFSQCAVCKDEFEADMELLKMPCDHIFHIDCIHPWLAEHNSCPICRHQLPTEDQYNQTHLQQEPVASMIELSIGGEANPGGNSDAARALELPNTPENYAPVQSTAMEESVDSSDVARGEGEKENPATRPSSV